MEQASGLGKIRPEGEAGRKSVSRRTYNVVRTLVCRLDGRSCLLFVLSLLVRTAYPRPGLPRRLPTGFSLRIHRPGANLRSRRPTGFLRCERHLRDGRRPSPICGCSSSGEGSQRGTRRGESDALRCGQGPRRSSATGRWRRTTIYRRWTCRGRWPQPSETKIRIRSCSLVSMESEMPAVPNGGGL